MSTSVRDAAAVDVLVDDTHLHVRLRDGREVLAPLEWFPRLRDADGVQRAEWVILGDGEGVHWPSIDEDVSVAGLLRAD